MHAVRWVVLVALLVVVAACGGVAEDGDRTSSSEVPTVLLAGDSMMEELATGLVAALDGVADARYVGLSRVVGNGAAPSEWERLLSEEGEPDLVVVLVGWWEAIGVSQLAGGIEAYPPTVAPLLQVLTARTEVLWLGYPALQLEPAVTTDQLAEAWATLPAAHPGVEFLDAGAAVELEGRYQAQREVDGRLLVLRQVDGSHLCPDGVVLMAEEVLAELQDRFGIEPAAGWQQGEWRTPGSFPDEGLCYAEDGTPRGIAS